MNRLKKLFKTFTLTLFLVSCGKETLKPAVLSKTVNQVRNDVPVQFSYEIDKAQIDEYAKGIKKFPVFGKFFQAIAVVIANTTISNNGGHDLEIDPIEVELSSLNQVDFEYIDWVRMDSLMAHIDNSRKKDNLEFIETIEIFAKFPHPTPELEIDSNGNTRVVFFDKKIHSLGCENKCLKFEVIKANWKELFKNNKKLVLTPKIVINSVPERSMSLAGSVSFSVKFNLGF